jgi:hypothetical protein
MSRANVATVRSVRDRVARAQRAYAQRLREAAESLHALVEEGDEEARAVQRAIEAELLHLTYGSAIVEE